MIAELVARVVGHLVDPVLDSLPADVAERALVDDPGDLELAVVAGEAEHQMPRLEERHGRVIGIFEERRTRHLEPDDVESLCVVIVSEPRTPSHDGAAAIGADDEIGGQDQIDLAPEPHADDSPPLRDEIADGLPAQEAEARERGAALDEHLEHFGLGDDARKQLVEVVPSFRGELAHEAAVAVHANASRSGLGELLEVVFEAHLPEGVPAAGHEGLAPELAREVLLALDQGDVDSSPGEEVGERGTSGARPTDHDTRHGARVRPRGRGCTPQCRHCGGRSLGPGAPREAGTLLALSPVERGHRMAATAETESVVDTTLEDGLLSLLRRRLDAPEIAYRIVPKRIKTGNENEVYAFELTGPRGSELVGRPLVLRLFGRETTALPRRASWEAAIHGALADQGLLVPRVLLVEDAGPETGGPFLILERLPGAGLIESVLPDHALVSARAAISILPGAVRLLLRKLPVLVARTERRLARLDTRRIVDAVVAAGFEPESLGFERHLESFSRRCEHPALEGLRPLCAWLRNNQPTSSQGPMLAHGDLAPNILVDGERITGVIDWSPSFVTVCDPAFEIGNTLVILSIKVPLPQPLAGLATVIQRAAIRRYLREVTETIRLDGPAVDYYQTFRCAHALLGVAESRLQEAGELEGTPRYTPWHEPTVAADLARQVQARSGVEVVLPSSPRARSDVHEARIT